MKHYTEILERESSHTWERKYDLEDGQNRSWQKAKKYGERIGMEEKK